MKGTVQGVVTRVKEDGKVSTMVHLTGIDFSDYDQEADVCLGKGVESVYVPRKVDCKPGDIVDVSYRVGFQGKAQLDKIEVIKRKE